MATLLLVAGAAAFHLPHAPRTLVARSHLAMEAGPEPRPFSLGPVITQGATAWIEAYPDRPIERMCISATEPPMTDEAISSFLQFMTDGMALGKPYTCLWDMSAQGCAFPSMGQFRRVIAWFETDNHSDEWDKLVRGHALVVTNPILRKAIQFMNSVARAPCPVSVVKDREDALTFLADIEGGQQSDLSRFTLRPTSPSSC